jgi:hypothetical protein
VPDEIERLNAELEKEVEHLAEVIKLKHQGAATFNPQDLETQARKTFDVMRLLRLAPERR